jgi:hypothetical protein
MIFPENRGKEKWARSLNSARFQQHRRETAGALQLPGELARGAGVWNMLCRCSSIIVHGFLSTLVRAMFPLHKKTTFRHSEKWKRVFNGHDVKTPCTTLIPILWNTHVCDMTSFQQSMHARWP